MSKKADSETGIPEEGQTLETTEIEYITDDKKTPRKRRTEPKDAKLKKYEAEIKILKEECENLKQEFLRASGLWIKKHPIRQKRLCKERQSRALLFLML